MSCSYLRHDAAYLLGALDPDERQRYEAHLETCSNCTRAVQEMAGIPGLLARLTPDQVAAAQGEREEPPPALLNSLLDATRRARRVSRWRVAAIASAAAACVGVAVTGVVVHNQTPATTSVASGVDLPLRAVGGTPVTATANLDDRAWGTKIVMRCEYDGGEVWDTSYVLVVRDRENKTQQVGYWKVLPGKQATVGGNTDLTRDQIRSIEVQTTDGVVVARGDVA